MKKTTVRAIFKGMDYSLGYRKGDIYTLTLYKPNFIEQWLFYNKGVDLIVMCEGHYNCPYSNAGFERNWRIVKL